MNDKENTEVTPLDKSSTGMKFNVLDGELSKTPTKYKLPLSDKNCLDN